MVDLLECWTTLICIYILLLMDGVSEHFNNQKLFHVFHNFLTSLYFNTVVEGLGAGQQDCGKLVLNFCRISCLSDNLYKILSDWKRYMPLSCVSLFLVWISIRFWWILTQEAVREVTHVELPWFMFCPASFSDSTTWMNEWLLCCRGEALIHLTGQEEPFIFSRISQKNVLFRGLEITRFGVNIFFID